MKKTKMSTKTKMLLLMVVGSMFVFGQGCFFGLYSDGPLEVGSGDLRVAWSFDGDSFCPLDVDSVVLEVRNMNGSRVFSDVILSCSAGLHDIPSLAEGTYVIRLVGVDIDDAITWESNSRSIEVLGDSTAELNMSLAPTE